MRRRRTVLVLVPLIAIALVVGGIRLVSHSRESRADGLAVKYGAAPSTELATLADRCTGEMREEYNTSDIPGKAGLGPKTWAFVAPKVCALGVERDLVRDDGTMTEQSGSELMMAVMQRIGIPRFQTRVFNELAVSRYHLAKAGQVTRWQRCVAMAYSGWDAAAPAGAGEPSLDVARRALRETCTIAVKRGIIPASGAPVTDSAAGRELQQIMLSVLGVLASA